MNKQNRKKTLCFIAAGTLLIGGLIAYLSDMQGFTNIFKVSKVDIEANEFSDYAHTKLYTPPNIIYDGQTVTKVVAVKQADASAESCWVRAKITPKNLPNYTPISFNGWYVNYRAVSSVNLKFPDSASGGDPVEDKQWTIKAFDKNDQPIATADWQSTSSGGGSMMFAYAAAQPGASDFTPPAYYYAYLDAGLEKGDTNYHDLFQQIYFEYYDNSMLSDDYTGSLDIEFEAIQKKGVTQDLTSNTPWGNIKSSDIVKLN